MSILSRDYLIWLDGGIVRQSEAKVSVLSSTAQFGLNVFEGVRAYWNDDRQGLFAFRLNDHLRRLEQSCRLIRLKPPFPSDEIVRGLAEVMIANDLREDAAVRITVYVGSEGSWSSTAPASLFIAPIARSRTDVLRIDGKAACISSWQRIGDNMLPPRAKLGANYLNGRYAHLQALADGYDLPIFLGSDGKVAEGAGACLFMIRDGELATPTITSSVLESITRATVIDIAQHFGMPVTQRDIDRTELYLADEIFLCGSAAEITPIGSVDRYQVGNGRAGITTLRFLNAYHALVSGEDERRPEWRTDLLDLG
jgi:branched-chain amino acid aminotransferase